ncbi:hypothetical protein ACFY5F_39030 [Streptomyces sp. NPDC013161]|uniref:hypothetical protein n=1 Tax=Streptomyces sp. NPDC013161 TaxID=3364862 RepID=UPI0036B1B0C0
MAMAAMAALVGLLVWRSAPAVVADDGTASATLRAARLNQPTPAYLNAADSSGYLSSQTPETPASLSAWVGRDGSTVEDLPTPIAVNGGFGLERAGETNTYRIRHYATGEVTRIDLPATDTSTDVFAGNRLMTLRADGDRRTLHLLEFPEGGGQPVDRQVSGFQEDITRRQPTDPGLDGPYHRAVASDGRGGVLRYMTVNYGTWRDALVDFATARLTYLAGGGSVQSLGGDRILLDAPAEHQASPRPYLLDRDRPDRPGTSVAQVPIEADAYSRVILGDWLVYADTAGGAVRAVPLAGGAARTLLPRSAGRPVSDPDGSLYIEGGGDARHWAVQHITLAGDGTPVAAAVVPLPPASVWEVGGMAVDRGRLLLATEKPAFPSTPEPDTYLTGFDLSRTWTGTVTAGPLRKLGDLGYEMPASSDHPSDAMEEAWHQPCFGDCLRFTGTGESSVAHDVHGVGEVVAAAGPYRVVRPSTGEAPGEDAAAGQEVRDGKKVLSQGRRQAAALWDNTLWTQGSTPGTVSAVSLPSLKPTGTASFGAPCVPEELQVVDRWIYWSCGPGGDTGVYDRVTRRPVAVPSGYAQLADGYLVTQDIEAGRLRITYFPGAVPAARTGTHDLAPLPSPVHTPQDRRGRSWAVDRFDGAIAYLDASGDVTVTWPRLRTSKASPTLEGPFPGTPLMGTVSEALLVAALAGAVTFRTNGRARQPSPTGDTTTAPNPVMDSGPS